MPDKNKHYQRPEATDIALGAERVIASSFEDGGEIIRYDNFEEEGW